MRSPARLAHRGQGRQAVHADAVALPLKGTQSLHDQAGPEQGQAVAQGLAGQKVQSLAIAGMQTEAHFRPARPAAPASPGRV